jgi:hypothetical protein
MAGADDIKPRGLRDSAGTAVNPDDCLHCFCQQDTGGNLKCCKCGSILLLDKYYDDWRGYGCPGET